MAASFLSLLAIVGGLVAIHLVDPAPAPAGATGRILVVAAENFWGSLAAQIGGDRVQVLSLVTDPNADPHEYESNASDAIAVADAALVIENGAGYDSWCAQLVTAAGDPGPRVLNVADLLGAPPGSNPHFWYSRSDVNRTLVAIFGDLVAADPSGSSAYRAGFASLNASLGPDWAAEATIDGRWGGDGPNTSSRPQVAATESVFVYLANATGLDLVSPPAFMNAVSEGSDPPANSVTNFEDQLNGGNVRVLVVNGQTQTPLTDQMRALASADHIPIVTITETIQPATASYEQWLGGELSALAQALAAGNGAS